MSTAHTDTGQEPGRTGHAPGHVVVIGGGISGLAAAHRALDGGARVTVLEASGRLGGKLRAGAVAGVPVDLGAESMLARRPEAVELARAVGLGDRLQPPSTATASLWTRGALRPMPKGHVMGVPGDAAVLAASGVLSEAGLARIEEDAELPRTEVGEDVAVGEYVAERLGREVVDRLVEPLLGGVYAGDAYRISMRAAVPQLFEAARNHRSLTEGVRAIQTRTAATVHQTGPAAAGPVFMGIDGGIGTLPGAVADAVRAKGGEIRLNAAVREVRRAGDGGWEVRVEDRIEQADAVILACPAPAAARILRHESPAAATELDGVEYASMALVTMAFRRADVEGQLTGSGFLVPPVDGHKIKAATFASNKWGWIDAADPDLFVLRTSIGRHGDTADLAREDAELVDLSLADLREAVGLPAAPVEARVTRWDGGLPQYPVGHLERAARIHEAVGRLPGLRVCGALYEGVGIPACIASATKAADAALATLTPGIPADE
ncbi:protoporphyrinogen oxidase [Streptomyces purpurogeneiscleroticus]|uniref:protoporphyrinogen oxidase n=1 Tax=Streptomyces purpurogeneiscleroticus TaxID=68259 RepID=UPI001CBB80D2|nr:protoporphyrinogen oxidase [Streptomyces purpurogeneiscleroticus]MBZ4016615.1 protoporphyrinogen oxidase [Streptomyces purpurogeneiscleroticus]